MKFGFINNFSQTLAADLGQGTWTMTLDGGGSLLANASYDRIYALTLDDGEGTTEVVFVWGATGNDISISKGELGTPDVTWPAGTAVEMRVPAGVLDAMAQQEWPIVMAPYGTDSPLPIEPILDTSISWAINGEGTVLLGGEFTLTDNDPGNNSLIGPIVIGAWCTINNDNGYNPIVIGHDISMPPASEDFIIIGTGAGPSPSQPGLNEFVVVGNNADCTGTKSTVIGCSAAGQGGSVSVLGADAVADQPFSSAIGYGAHAGVEGAFVCSGLSTVPNETRAAGFGAASAPGSCMRSSQQVVMRSDTLGLSGANEFELTLPAGVVLFIDGIDVVALGAVSGSPEISVGTTSGGAELAAATALTITTANERQMITPSIVNGVSGSVFCNVSTTGAGNVRVILKGYALQS